MRCLLAVFPFLHFPGLAGQQTFMFVMTNEPRRYFATSAHIYPMWLWGHSLFKISSSGPVLHGVKWLLWRPHIQSPTLHSRCGINKGLIKGGSTIDHWRSRYKGWILWPIPYTYIHISAHTRPVHKALFSPPHEVKLFDPPSLSNGYP
jgi:hypothetical protein